MNNRIRQLRKQKNLTMKQLGEALGLAESTISQYETGKREPDIGTILKICEYFNVTLDYLLGIVDEQGFMTGEGFADPEDFAFIKALGYDNPDICAKRRAKTPEVRILSALEQLNAEGKEVAVQRVEELTEIPKYQKKPPQD